jgi:hypothetical protein
MAQPSLSHLRLYASILVIHPLDHLFRSTSANEPTAPQQASSILSYRPTGLFQTARRYLD